MLSFGPFLLSECGVIAMWLHPNCTTTTLLHFSHLCEYSLGASLAEINQFAGCIFPYETRGMLDICDGILEVFPWPGTGREPGSLTTHGFLLTVDIYGDDSVLRGPLDKLI